MPQTQWLERAGFKPGCRVEVQIGQPGTLTLRFLEQSSPPANMSRPDILQGRASASAWARQGVLELEQANLPQRGTKPVRNEITGQKPDSENLSTNEPDRLKAENTLILLH